MGIFKTDLLTGEIGENAIAETLANHFKWQYMSHSEKGSKEYDLLFHKVDWQNLIIQDITVECKTDEYTKDTGNMFIEFECGGKPSGITATKADIWANYFLINGEVWTIRRIDLIHLLNTNNFPRVKGGDVTDKHKTGKTMGHLITNREAHRQHFTIIPILGYQKPKKVTLRAIKEEKLTDLDDWFK